MRIDLLGRPEAVAANPEEALSALADIAEADGADRDEWLEKAITSAGATSRAIEVVGDPRHQIVEDIAHEAVMLYLSAMFLARQKIKQRLEQAVRDADRERYRALLPDQE